MTLIRERPIPITGERLILSPSDLSRFLSKVTKFQILDDPTDGPCWIWLPPVQSKGYGRFYLGRDDEGKQLYRGSHVISYMHYVGPIPEGWIVDHLCNNKACCAPDHLEAIPNLLNLQRAHQRRPWRRVNQFETDWREEREGDWRFAL